MKTINILKMMIDLFFYGQVLVVLVVLVSIFEQLFFSNHIYNIGGQTFTNLDALTLSFMFFVLLRIASFIFGIYHLKKITTSFLKEKIFTLNSSHHMKMVGIGFIAYSIAEAIGESLNAAITQSGDTFLSLNFMGFKSGWFQFTLGVFFIYLDLVFRKGNKIQQENDLTI